MGAVHPEQIPERGPEDYRKAGSFTPDGNFPYRVNLLARSKNNKYELIYAGWELPILGKSLNALKNNQCIPGDSGT